MLDTALADGQLSGLEHRERISAATSATTLDELTALVSDLQTDAAIAVAPTAGPTTRFGRAPRWVKPALAAALVVLGVGIGWGLSGGSTPGGILPASGPAADPGAAPDGIAPVVLTPPRQLQSLGGLTGLFEQMSAKFGDTMGYRLVIYPDYASLDRPDPDEERRVFNYSYRGGWDDPSSSSRRADARLVDLAGFDHQAVVGILRGAPETLGIKPDDVKNTYLIIDPSDDPTTPEAVELSVHVSSEFGSGSLRLNPDGTQKRINYPS